MKSISVTLVNGQRVTLGNHPPKGIDGDGLFRISRTGRVSSIDARIEYIKSVNYAGVSYKDVVSLLQENHTWFNDEVVCCKVNNELEWAGADNPRLDTCPFNCTNAEECAQKCDTFQVYRGKYTIGFDMAQPLYSHDREYIVISRPNHIFQREV